MDVDAVPDGAWRTRLRWRLRGALTWPLFVMLTLLETLLLHVRPVAGKAIEPAAAFLLVAFLNLLVVAVAAPLIARWSRRRGRTTAPLAIATDRVAAVALVAVAVVLAVGGVLRHSSVVALQREDAAAQSAVVRYVHAQAPAYLAGLTRVDVEKPGTHLYRICVPGGDPHRALCLYVETNQSPPGVIVDPNQEPNSVMFGPDRRDG